MNAYVAILIALLALVIAFINIYNSLIAKRNQVKNIRASIDAALKNRYDLIPNLVSSVSRYAEHENELLTKVTELRSKAMNANESENLKINNELSSTLGGIKILSEAYPELKANENFIELQKSLNEIEAQLSAVRRAYNSAVMIYNNALEMFPSNIVASWFKFSHKEFFQAPQNEQNTPDVKDLFKRD
ncbi:LemA family protein [Campylobacter sp. RM9328]|uniref:LemA family protein n=1 Tax=Campylobacter sp. RM9328 TaxID=1705720 RepID=UPI001474FB09|nr:LemA family protein [Campylobacter sp. RM9328]